MTTATVSNAGWVPEPIRLFCWRVWMVLRVPIYGAVGLLMGIFALVTLIMYGWLFAMLACIPGALAGLAVALVVWVFGVTPTEQYAAAGGGIAVLLMVVYYSGIGIRRAYRALRADTPLARIRRVVDATAMEWREAADRWPSRQPPSLSQQPATWLDDVDVWPDEDREEPEPAPPPLQPDLRPRTRTKPIVAWRGWNIAFEPVGPFRRQPVLSSLGVSAAWDTASVTAVCWRNIGLPHAPSAPVPAVACSCGLYAVKRRDQIPHYSGDMRAFGPVELTGRVLEFERGYRAEHGRIVGPLLVVLECGSVGCNRAPVVILSNEQDDMPACMTHSSAYDDVGAFDIDDFVVQLQARLELRYGVEAYIRKGAHSWT